MQKRTKKRRSPSVMPLKTYIQEARQLLSVAMYYQKSAKYELSTLTLSQTQNQIESLAQAETDLKIKIFSRSENENEWSELSRKAFQLRKEMLRILKFAHRCGDPNRIHFLKQLKANNSVACLINDLYVLAKLWNESGDSLAQINYDYQMGHEALHYAKTIVTLQTTARLDREDCTLRDIRDQAYYALRDTVKELRLWAGYNFKEYPQIMKQFASNFYKKRNAKARTKKTSNHPVKIKAIDVSDKPIKQIARSSPIELPALTLAEPYPLRLLGS